MPSSEPMDRWPGRAVSSMPSMSTARAVPAIPKIRYGAKTDVGRQRDHNEDSFLVDEEERLFIVCDGMGGHAAGEVASKMAVDTLAGFFKKSRGGDVTWPFKVDPELPLIENRLSCGAKLASYHIYLEARADQARRGMGTTLVAAAFADGKVHIVHVGDSRCYRLRGDGDLERLTRDHSLLEEFKKFNPGMTAEEEKNFGHRSVLNRALGVKETVEPELGRPELMPGAPILLCSDGLHGQVDDALVLATIASARDDLDGAVAELIERANHAGGIDNVTVVLIAYDG